jgi:hypothetical protein
MILVEKEVLVERLADCERTDTDRALGLQQMALRIRRWRPSPVSACLVRNPRPEPYCPSRESRRSPPQDFGELIVKEPWLNQAEPLIVGHGESLSRWRRGGLNLAKICRPLDRAVTNFQQMLDL